MVEAQIAAASDANADPDADALTPSEPASASASAIDRCLMLGRPQTRPRYKVDEDSITPLDPELALMINACSGMDKSSRSTYDLRGKTVMFIKQASAIVEGQLLVGLKFIFVFCELNKTYVKII